MKSRIIIGLILCIATFLLMQQLPSKISVLLSVSVGNEKVLGDRSILQASLQVNIDFNDLAIHTVNYTFDKQNYSHNLSNNSSPVDLKLAYFLNPINK
jgi:hypothetical protein